MGLEKLVTTIYALKDRYVLNITGAELLIDSEYVRRITESNQKGFMTNGLALYKNVNLLDKLLEWGVKYVALSYHHMVQEEYSPIPKYKVEWVIKELITRRIDVSLMSTVTKVNYDKIDDACRIAESLGAKRIHFTNFTAQGNARKISDMWKLNDKEIQVFFERYRECVENYPNLIVEKCCSFGKDVNEPCAQVCAAGKDKVAITPDGNVYPCFFLAEKGNEIGRFDNGIITIFREIDWDGTDCLSKRVLNYNGALNYK